MKICVNRLAKWHRDREVFGQIRDTSGPEMGKCGLSLVPLLLFQTAYGMLMMYSGGMEKLMQFVGLYSLIMGLKVVVALLYLRYTKPMLERPYKVSVLMS